MKKIIFLLLAALLALSFPGEGNAAPREKVRFHVLTIEINDGEAVVHGELLNETGHSVSLSLVRLGLLATDKNGDAVADETAEFFPLDIYIETDDVVEHTFILENSDISSYDDRFQWRVKSHLEWNDA